MNKEKIIIKGEILITEKETIIIKNRMEINLIIEDLITTKNNQSFNQKNNTYNKIR